MAAYTDDLAEKILEVIMNGGSVDQAAEAVGISARTIYRWTLGQGAPESFCQEYVRAQEIRAERMGYECLTIADHKGSDFKKDASGELIFDESGNPVIDHDNIQRARLQIDTRKFLMGQWSGKYSQKVNIGGQKDNPVVFKNIRDEELDARISELAGKAGIAISTGRKETEESKE